MGLSLRWGLGASLPILALALTAAALANCSSNDETPPADAGDEDVDTRPPTPPDWDRAVTRPDDTTAAADRAACKFKRGDLPAETLGTSTPVDKDIPIDTVVVLVMENHSFDNYFGQLGKYLNRSDIESPPPGASNPAIAGQGSDAGTDAGDDGGSGDGGATDGGDGGAPQTFPYTHASHLCTLDTNHEWDGTHLEYDDGKMDGFVQANEGWDKGKLTGSADPSLASGARAMVYYDQTDLPFYYDLAKDFAIADHYHCSVLGPTWPNRMYVYAATSFGRTTNDFPDLSAYPFPDNDASILDELEKRHVDWWLYTDSPPTAAVVHGIALGSRYGRIPTRSVANFMSDAAAGTLPQVTFLDPDTTHEGPKDNDEHPPAQIQIGQKFVSDVVHAVMTSPQWAHIALFVTWDEHGGFYDHVPPPPACAPDDKTPVKGDNSPETGAFDRYGVRVPFILVSPYAKKGYVGHATYDHTSITRFIEAKFKVPALTARDANADPLMDLFDFQNPPWVTPPTIAEPTIDQGEVDYCAGNYQ